MATKAHHKNYICDRCFNEQDDPGYCEDCFTKVGETVEVIDTDTYFDQDFNTWVQNHAPKGVSLDDRDGAITDTANTVELEPIQLAPSNSQYNNWESWSDAQIKAHNDAVNSANTTADEGNYDYGVYGDWSDKAKEPQLKYDPSKNVPSGTQAVVYKNQNKTKFPPKVYGGASNFSYGGGSSNYKKKAFDSLPPKRAKEWCNHNFWFIGDVHKNIESYLEQLKKIRTLDPLAITIQVGDIGIGECDLPKLGDKDFFIAGNHDYPEACHKHPNYLGDFGYKHGVFFMGGAASKGMAFHKEELDDKELEAAIKLYKEVKPEIVVTHDCPEMIRKEYFPWSGKPKNTRTTAALDEMWLSHGPAIWAFGHMHSSMNENAEGTNFICCAPLEAQQIRMSWINGSRFTQSYTKPMQQTNKQALDAAIESIFK